MRFARFAVLGLLVCLAAALTPAVVAAWENGPESGNGYGTHDWVLQEALRLAKRKGVDWVDRAAALAATDDPDTELRDSENHHLDLWGDRYGRADIRIAEMVDEVLRLRKSGDLRGASIALGRLSHYFADVCNPLHTDDASSREDGMHADYEAAVNRRTDQPGESAGWVTYDGNQPMLSAVRTARRAATMSHRAYKTLVVEYARDGFGATARRITKTSLNRAVNGLADMLVTMTRGVTVTSFGAKGNDTGDDTIAVKAALSAVATKGGGTVFVPAGEYRVTSITVPSGVSLSGEGSERSWLRGAVTASGRQTMSDLQIGAPGVALRFANKTSDATLERCRIVGGPPAIIMAGNVVRDVTFRDCVIDASRTRYANAVSLSEVGDATSHYENIVFDGCHFMGSTRMTVEILQRGSMRAWRGYRNISFLRCVFEPSDTQVISYDCPVLDAGVLSGNCRIEDCVFKGAGADPDGRFPHHLEINGPRDMVVKGNLFLASRGSALNLHGSDVHHVDDRPLGWITVTGNTFDMTRGVTPHEVRDVVNTHGSGTILRSNVFTVNNNGQVFLIRGANNLIEGNDVTDVREKGGGYIIELDEAPGNVFSGNTLRAAGRDVRVRGGSGESVFRENVFATGQSQGEVFQVTSGVAITLVGNVFK